MNRVLGLFKYVLENFGPLIAFYFVNHFYGLKAAILAAILTVLLEVVRFRIQRRKLTAFFLFSAVIAVTFGAVDLTLDAPFFFRFEAGIINLLFALFFGWSLFRAKPILQEFAEQGGHIDQSVSDDRTFFFRLLTMGWVLYFVVKAIVFTWINLNHSIERGLLLRMVIGNLSLGIMLFISIGLARPIWRVLIALKAMPSTRKSERQ